MIDIRDLKDRFLGRPAAVLGGGPSLPGDLAVLPKDTILIAVNNHALHFCNPDYMVFMDIPGDQTPDLAQAVRTFDGFKVSQTPLTDIDVRSEKYWDGGFSSPLATWFACYLGCDPVLLCGMDCYQGEVKYAVPRPDFYHPCMDAPLEDHLRAWRPAFEHCPNPQRIRAVSGPLVQMFGIYAPITML